MEVTAGRLPMIRVNPRNGLENALTLSSRKDATQPALDQPGARGFPTAGKTFRFPLT